MIVTSFESTNKNTNPIVHSTSHAICENCWFSQSIGILEIFAVLWSTQHEFHSNHKAICAINLRLNHVWRVFTWIRCMIHWFNIKKLWYVYRPSLCPVQILIKNWCKIVKSMVASVRIVFTKEKVCFLLFCLLWTVQYNAFC